MRDVYSGQAVHHCPLSAQMDSGVTMVQNVHCTWIGWWTLIKSERELDKVATNSQMEQIWKKTRPTRATSARSATRAARAIRATWTTTAIMAIRAFAPELESEMVIFGHELCDVALAGENECWCFKFLGTCFQSLKVSAVAFQLSRAFKVISFVWFKMTLVILMFFAFTLFMWFKIASLNCYLATLVTFKSRTNILVCAQQMFFELFHDHTVHI